MKLKSKYKIKSKLALSALVLMASSVNAQTLLTTVPAAAPAPVPAMPAVAAPAAPAVQQAVPAAPAAPQTQAVSALQANIQAQQAQQQSQSQAQSSDLNDEATLVRQVAKKQAKLSLLLMEAKVDKALMDAERERLKFEKEKNEATAAANPVPVAQPAPAAGGAALPVAAIAPVEEAPLYTVKSTYSFDGKSFAEISNGTSKVVATPGSTLPGGAKVVSISASSVVIAPKNGKKITLFVDSSK